MIDGDGQHCDDISDEEITDEQIEWARRAVVVDLELQIKEISATINAQEIPTLEQLEKLNKITSYLYFILNEEN